MAIFCSMFPLPPKITASPCTNTLLIRRASFFLLALQAGLSPILYRVYVGRSVVTTAYAICSEVIKFILSACLLTLSGEWGAIFGGWDIKESIRLVGFPAIVLSFQSIITQIAYANLEPLTFTLLNQSKTVFTAIFVYILLGRKQSLQQIAALVLLVTAAGILASSSSSGRDRARVPGLFWAGVAPALVGACLSGFSAALCQRSLQAGGGRSAVLFSLEVSVYSGVFMLMSLVFSPDGAQVRSTGFFTGFEPGILISLLCLASGGILVGLVTRYAGSVEKGFAMELGIL